MYRIGEFSRLTKTTIKTLRYYDDTGLMKPAAVDEFTGYRYYTTEQLYPLQRILAYRQAGLGIGEIKSLLAGGDAREILEMRLAELRRERDEAEARLSRINALLGDVEVSMNYQAVVKQIPGFTVYSKEGLLDEYSQATQFILQSAQECIAANPGIECVKPDYCFIEYLDGEFRERDVRLRYSQAVIEAGVETDVIKFRTLAPVEAACVYHKGAYEKLGEAYAYCLNWVKENGFEPCALPRECYIDGPWNKDDIGDYLTELQIPVRRA